MKNTLTSILKILTLILILAFAFVVYKAFSTGTVTLNTEPEVVGEELFAVRDKLNSLRLDKSIFDSEALAALESLHEEIEPELAGRADPFAPIGRDSRGVLVGSHAAAATTTTNTTTGPAQ